jgi:hypothetical protein
VAVPLQEADAANMVAVPLSLAPLAALLVELGAREVTRPSSAEGEYGSNLRVPPAPRMRNGVHDD